MDAVASDETLSSLVTYRAQLEQTLRSGSVSIPPGFLATLLGSPDKWRERPLTRAELDRFRATLQEVNAAIERHASQRWGPYKSA